MKIFSKSIILGVILLAVSATTTIGQTPKTTSVYAVDFVKTKNGEQADYLKFIEQNWARARQFMKEKGIVASFQSVSIPAAKDAQWDALLVTEYVDQAGYERRETVFEEYRKANPATSVNGKSSREMSEIKFSRTFNQSISSEVWEIMLKTQNPDLEQAAVRVPLENYLKGHATGDGEYMKKAFYSEGKMIFVREGKYMSRTFEEYIKGMSGKPADDEAQRRRWIEKVEMVGNAAVGTIILDYPAGKFVDYMTLLKIDGEWKIINKSFHFEPKPQQQTKTE